MKTRELLRVPNALVDQRPQDLSKFTIFSSWL
jgi:hypothetical protein